MGLCCTPGCSALTWGWPDQVCMWQGLKKEMGGRLGKLMVLSFGKEVVTGKLASHSS